MPRTKPQKAYYSAHALSDGTIYFALQTRKPVKSNSNPDVQIDEDGIWRWYFDKLDEGPLNGDRAVVIRNVCIATTLNVRRIIRERVGKPLEALDQSVTDLKAQLDRIEQMLASLNVKPLPK